MKDRIKSYMDYKGISAGELSLSLDVQRSNISHILNGRNMPGAAFIEKLLLKYPDLDARWLLTGEGEMIQNYSENDKIINPAALREEKIINSEEKKAIAVMSPSDEKRVDKIVLLFSDGTFIDYKK
jgi:transcriptional regulator with XRE-family HTH domain